MLCQRGWTRAYLLSSFPAPSNVSSSSRALVRDSYKYRRAVATNAGNLLQTSSASRAPRTANFAIHPPRHAMTRSDDFCTSACWLLNRDEE